MKLEMYTASGWLPIINRQKYCTTYEYDGLQTLCFDVSPQDEVFPFIKNEVLVRNDENLYIIKSIHNRGQVCTISCSLDLDDWYMSQPYPSTKDLVQFQNKTLMEILNLIKPAGWSIQNAGIRETRCTPDVTDAPPYVILMECQKLYDVVYQFDTIGKKLTVIDPFQQVDLGLYITPELNRSNLTYIGDSKERITRISAYGKKLEDGSYVNFSSINDGKEYVEDISYDQKIKWMIWREDACESPEELYLLAKKQLKSMAFPKMSYTVSVNDLAKYDKDYAFLDFQLYRLVHTIIDEHTTIVQDIVQLKRYHDAPKQNEITLSTEAKKISSKTNDAIRVLGEDGRKFSGSILQKAQDDATALINAWAEKGYVYLTENEIYILDRLPKERAMYCIKMDLGGIAFSNRGWQGPYVSAWSIDGKFNADFITAGTIRGIELIGNRIHNGKNFSVNEDGLLTCKDADISGKITSQSGSIAGWNVDENGLYSRFEYDLPKYTQEDLDKVRDHILGIKKLTKEEEAYYDVSCDGYISSLDYNMINDVITGRVDSHWIYEVRLNAKNYKSIIEVSVDQGNGFERATTISAFGIRSKTIDRLSSSIDDLRERIKVLEKN